jgi:hypothetical protein
MNFKKGFNYGLYLFIAFVLTYLTIIFFNLNIDGPTNSSENPRVSVGTFFLFLLYCGSWIMFFFGLFELKNYINGKNNSTIITFIFGSFFIYGIFLLIVLDFKNIRDLFSSPCNKITFYIISSLIILIFSRTSFIKKLRLNQKLKE